MTDDGASAVRAIVRGGLQQVLARSGRQAADPEVGEPRQGVEPGEWGAPPLMPPECPVIVLGKAEGVLYLVDVDGMLSGVDPSSFGQKYVISIFGDRINYVYWAWPRFGKKKAGQRKPPIDNFRAERVFESFHGEASRRVVEFGMWNPTERVRGRGAWPQANGGIIYHAGSYLWINGQLMKAGTEIDGQFYPLRPPVPLPWPEPVQDGDPQLVALGRLLKTWSWGRAACDPFLVLGWMASAQLSGALRTPNNPQGWRPSMFLVGDKAVGKTTLQNLMKNVLGGGVIKTADTTEAGIYQRLGMDALPVQIDELEAGADNRRVMAVVNLARIAASGELRLRGGQDHKGIDFIARSCFFFSAINPPPVGGADWSRLALVSVKKLDPEKIRDAPVLSEAQLAETGRRMLRRLLDQWPQFDPLFTQYAAALRAGGHDQRGQDTYGTFLTMAHLLLGDEGVDALGLPIDSFDPWGEWLNVRSLPEVDDQEPNWLNCLKTLIGYQADQWRGGGHVIIGGVLDDLRRGGQDRTVTIDKARSMLAQVGLGLLEPGKADPFVKGYCLAIPNRGNVGKIFANTIWTGGPSGAGVWASALRQGPADIVIGNARNNRVRINGDVHRCTIVSLDGLDNYWARAEAADA